MLKREFDLDDEALEDLKEALLFSGSQVKEEDGRGLVWVGDEDVTAVPPKSLSQTQTPALYTPPLE